MIKHSHPKTQLCPLKEEAWWLIEIDIYNKFLPLLTINDLLFDFGGVSYRNVKAH
jgi:hypothetical protein